MLFRSDLRVKHEKLLEQFHELREQKEFFQANLEDDHKLKANLKDYQNTLRKTEEQLRLETERTIQAEKSLTAQTAYAQELEERIKTLKEDGWQLHVAVSHDTQAFRNCRRKIQEINNKLIVKKIRPKKRRIGK